MIRKASISFRKMTTVGTVPSQSGIISDPSGMGSLARTERFVNINQALRIAGQRDPKPFFNDILPASPECDKLAQGL
jgi:hypothetical protein